MCSRHGQSRQTNGLSMLTALTRRGLDWVRCMRFTLDCWMSLTGGGWLALMCCDLNALSHLAELNVQLLPRILCVGVPHTKDMPRPPPARLVLF